MKSIVKPIFLLWPGSTGAMRYGLWGHLGVALLFGVICQFTVFLNFYWVDFLSSFTRACTWGCALVAWLFLSVTTSSSLKRFEKTLDADSSGEAFLEAQTHYLCGNWFETECCLKSLLKKNPYDVEALLLKATLYRHLRRFSESRKTLAELERIDASSYWREEIEFEKKAIVEDENEKDDVEEESDDETQETEGTTDGDAKTSTL